MARRRNVDMVEEARDEEKDAEHPGEEAHGAEERKEMRTGEELARGGAHHGHRGHHSHHGHGHAATHISVHHHKKGGKVAKKRARGGHVNKHGELDGAVHHAHHVPHHMKRKRGGHVKGEAPMHRPDRRARGGGTSDLNPFTAAGKMHGPHASRD